MASIAAVTQTGSSLLTVVSWAALALALAGALAISGDIAVAGYRQRMGVMNLVWPITALYWGPVAVWFYFRRGQRSSRRWEREHGDEVPESSGEEGEPDSFSYFRPSQLATGLVLHRVGSRTVLVVKRMKEEL